LPDVLTRPYAGQTGRKTLKNFREIWMAKNPAAGNIDW
jgi:hypothetical protein